MASLSHTFHERGQAVQCEPGSYPDGCKLGADCSARRELALVRQWLQDVGSSWTTPIGEKHWRRALRPNPDPNQARDGNETRPSPATCSLVQVQSAESRRQRKGQHALGKKRDLE